MRAGDLVRLRPWVGDFDFQVFSEVSGEWSGIILHFDAPSDHTPWHLLRVLLSSHGGVVAEGWITKEEFERHIEVISEAG